MALQLLSKDTRIEVRDADLDGVTDGDPDTVYVLRQLPPAESREIAKRHTTTPINQRTGRREEQVDLNAVAEDLLDAALVEWRGVLANGLDAPCTRENKLLLDGVRRTALLHVAGLNRSAEVRAASFR